MAWNLKIGSVAMPEPDEKDGIIEAYEAIWSSDTGRTTKGVMKGTLVCTVRKTSLKWSKGLTPSQAIAIKNKIVKAGFTTISYKNSLGENISYEGYFGTPTMNQFNFKNVNYVTDFSVDFIGKRGV